MLNEQLNDLYRNNLVNLMEMYSVLDGQKNIPLCCPFAYLLLGRTLFKFKIQINDYRTRNKWLV